MQGKVKGGELLPRLVPIPRRVPPTATPKSPTRRVADRLSFISERPGAKKNAARHRRGLVIFPVLELLGIATLIFLLAK